LRRTGNTNHGWEAVGPSTIVSYNSPQGMGHCDPASMLETRLGVQNGKFSFLNHETTK